MIPDLLTMPETAKLAIPRDEAGVAHVVALSGGKDSTAMALRLREIEPRGYVYVCTPTGDELPELIDHWNGLAEVLGQRLLPITSLTSLQGLIRKWDALPNHRQRWCTRVLKLEPFYSFLGSIKPAISYVGLRADEEGRGGMEFPNGEGIAVRRPMQEWGWGLNDVWAYLESIAGHTKLTMAADIPIRTDCARCYAQTLGEWWRLWRFHPEIYTEAEEEEQRVSDVRGKAYTFRSPQRDTWPASLAELRQCFERGEVPRGSHVQADLLRGERRQACRVCSL